MMQSRILLTLLATIGTSSFLAQASESCSTPGKKDSSCPGGAQIGWCSNSKTCCPDVQGTLCGEYLPGEYYERTINTTYQEAVCWVDGPVPGYQNCWMILTLKQDGDGGYSNLPPSAAQWVLDSDGCPRCNINRGGGGDWDLFPYSIELKTSANQCKEVDVPGLPDASKQCPNRYTPPTPFPGCSVDFVQISDGDCLYCPAPKDIVNDVCVECNEPDYHVINGKCEACELPWTKTTTQCVCPSPYYVVEGQCVECKSPFVVTANQCQCPEGEIQENDTCVQGSGPGPDDPSDNSDGFPLWLLILIIALAVIAAVIATWLTYRCCKKEPESDIEEASNDGVQGERGSFFAASCAADSEMQIMTGIACADGAKAHISAVDPNWSPNDESITARRTTPEPVDRQNVIRQGQGVEHV